MDKIVYLIRHGQTDFNLKGMVQGRFVNSDLNKTGQKQASAFFECYKHINFDKIYISKLKRTYQSIEFFITKKHIPFEKFSGLDEISWGEMEGIKMNRNNYLGYNLLIDNWCKGNYDAKILSGENPLEVRERQKTVWKTIMERSEEKIILICMHGRSMRILLTMVLELELSKMGEFEHNNLCLYLLEYESGSWQVKKKNNTQHLQ